MSFAEVFDPLVWDSSDAVGDPVLSGPVAITGFGPLANLIVGPEDHPKIKVWVPLSYSQNFSSLGGREVSFNLDHNSTWPDGEIRQVASLLVYTPSGTVFADAASHSRPKGDRVSFVIVCDAMFVKLFLCS